MGIITNHHSFGLLPGIAGVALANRAGLNGILAAGAAVSMRNDGRTRFLHCPRCKSVLTSARSVTNVFSIGPSFAKERAIQPVIDGTATPADEARQFAKTYKVTEEELAQLHPEMAERRIVELVRAKQLSKGAVTAVILAALIIAAVIVVTNLASYGRAKRVTTLKPLQPSAQVPAVQDTVSISSPVDKDSALSTTDETPAVTSPTEDSAALNGGEKAIGEAALPVSDVETKSREDVWRALQTWNSSVVLGDAERYRDSYSDRLARFYDHSNVGIDEVVQMMIDERKRYPIRDVTVSNPSFQ